LLAQATHLRQILTNLDDLVDLGEIPDPLVPDAIADDLAADIAEAFGLFGLPERCLEHLLRAHEFAGVEYVFLSSRDTGYELPVREMQAFGRVMRPALDAHSGT